eukprot:2258104-Amphidinium_carterae.3
MQDTTVQWLLVQSAEEDGQFQATTLTRVILYWDALKDLYGYSVVLDAPARHNKGARRRAEERKVEVRVAYFGLAPMNRH